MSQSNQKQPEDQKDKLNAYARFSAIAFQMFAIIAIGTFVGVKLDAYFLNQHKIFTIIFSLSAVILSIIYVIRRIIAGSKDNE